MREDMSEITVLACFVCMVVVSGEGHLNKYSFFVLFKSHLGYFG
jgi:hypothetical protein